jgi:hypothetical protein
VLALANVFPTNSLGEMGTVACMAAIAVGVSHVRYDMMCFPPRSMPVFYVDVRLVVCVADASLRRSMKSVRSRGLFPCARARFPPSIPSVDGKRSGARISSDAALCLCRRPCTTALLPAPTATFFLITLRHPTSRASSPPIPRPMPCPGSHTVPGFAHL